MNQKYYPFLAVSLFALAACEKPVEQTPDEEVVVIDTDKTDECPRADGEPCE